MNISLIVAHSKDLVIGKNNQLPWHLSEDLKYFKKVTTDKPIIMGRKTFESIGKALPNRKNIVITRDRNFQARDVVVAHSLDEAILEAKAAEEIMIIGGATLFEQALPIVTRMYITVIHHTFEGDTFFPNYNADEWSEIFREDHFQNEKNPYNYSFITLQRKSQSCAV